MDGKRVCMFPAYRRYLDVNGCEDFSDGCLWLGDYPYAVVKLYGKWIFIPKCENNVETE